MRRLLVSLVVVSALAGCGGNPQERAARALPPVPDRCVDRAPCVYVTPDPEVVRAPGTIYVYRGRAWPPRVRVQADFGSYCDPASTGCDGVGLSARFRADRRGRFTFRLRHGNKLRRGVPRPAAAGGEADSISFSTSGRRGHVTRDAIPPPPPTTPQQRREARAVAAVLARADRDIEREDDTVPAASERIQRERSRCGDLHSSPDPEVDRVLLAVNLLSGDGAIVAEIRPALDAFAAGLESLALTDPVLRDGAAAWVAAIRVERYRPQPDMCAVMRQWRDTGYAPEARPVDPDTPEGRQLDEDVEQNPAIRAAAKRLRAMGAGRTAEERFRGGLLDLADLIGEAP